MQHDLSQTLETNSAVRRARNLFQLSLSPAGWDVTSEDVLGAFSGRMSAEELQALSEFYAARSRACQVVQDVAQRVASHLEAQSQAFLHQFATPQGHDMYAFTHESGAVVSVRVESLEWLKVSPEGEVAGALRVRPRANTTESWLFTLKERKIVICSDAMA